MSVSDLAFNTSQSLGSLIYVDGYIVDSGSLLTLVPRSFTKVIDATDCKTLPRLVAANGTTIKAYGRCRISVKVDGKSYCYKAIVADVWNPILGLDFFGEEGSDLVILPCDRIVKRRVHAVNLVDSSLNQCKMDAEALLESFPDITSGSLGETKSLTIPLKIDTANNDPVYSSCRPLYGPRKDEIEAELNKWLAEGIIAPVDGPVRWASPIHPVKKSDGTWRVCGDFRRLNNATVPDKYPLPSMTNFNDRMNGSVVFSKLDLRRAYHQVEVEPSDQDKTIITTTLGLFKFLRVPFGLKNAGAVFQRNINLILQGMERFCFIYMDDIIVFSPDCASHIDHLNRIFKALSKHKILVNPGKCQFAATSLEFLGHNVSTEGIGVPEARIKAIQQFPKPESVKDLEKFLGMFAYVHRFIPRASAITDKLHDMRKFKTQKSFSQAWSEECDLAFNQAKQSIVANTKLIHPRRDAPTELWTDASDIGLGAVLVQEVEGNWKPIAFWSKSFNKAQRNYSTYDRELLAISYSVAHFRGFFEGQSITVRTDHRPLVSAFKNSSTNATPLQRRHFNYICQFVDCLEYRRGEENFLADTMSRVTAQKAEELSDDGFMDTPLVNNEADCVRIGNVQPALPSPLEFRQAQERDRSLMVWIEEQQASSHSEFKIQLVPCKGLDGVDVMIYADASVEPPRILVPSLLQRQVFNYCHSLAHLGSKSCYNLLRKTHYWPKMLRDIQDWCKACMSCKRNKISRHTKSFVQKLPDPTDRFSHIHVDLVGPMLPNDNVHLFTIIDRWTSWPEALPTTATDTKTLARLLIDNWISRFGVPSIITSDRGGQFTSALWKEVTELMGIKQDLTTAYHPQHNGKVERLHRTLENSLRSRLDGRKDWLDQLPWVLLGLRNSLNNDKRHSPSVMVFGQPLTIPGHTIKTTSMPIEESLFGEQLAKAMRAQTFQESFWNSANKSFIPSSLKDCPMVLVRDDKIKGKLAPRYIGPFKVVDRHDKVFRLQFPDKVDTVSIDRLVPFDSPIPDSSSSDL